MLLGGFVSRLYLYKIKMSVKYIFQKKNYLFLILWIFLLASDEKNPFIINLFFCTAFYAFLENLNVPIDKSEQAIKQFTNIILILFTILFLSSLVEISYSPKEKFLTPYFNVIRAHSFFMNANLYAAFVSLLYFFIRLINKNDNKCLAITFLSTLNILCSGSRSLFLVLLLFEFILLIFSLKNIKNILLITLILFILSFANTNNWLINNFKNETHRMIDSKNLLINYFYDQSKNKISYRQEKLDASMSQLPITQEIDKNVPISGRLKKGNSLSDNTFIALYSSTLNPITSLIYTFLFVFALIKTLTIRSHKKEYLQFFIINFVMFSTIRIHVFPLNILFTIYLFHLFENKRIKYI